MAYRETNNRPYALTPTFDEDKKRPFANDHPYKVWVMNPSSGAGGGSDVTKEYVLQKVAEEADARKDADSQINIKIENITNEVAQKLDDAPKDGRFYGRENGEWSAGEISTEEI